VESSAELNGRSVWHIGSAWAESTCRLNRATGVNRPAVRILGYFI
jgi:hypothetical protein